MKKIVLTFGLISGLVASALMILTMPFIEEIGFDRGVFVGYAGILASMLVIHFGVRAYRDNVAGGSVRFGRAFGVAMLIGAVSTVFYAATWEVIYLGFKQDFPEKYAAYQIESEKKKGVTGAELVAREAEIMKSMEMYKKPMFNFLFTLLEPLPVVLLVSLISAGVLSRGRSGTGAPPISI